MVMIIGVGFFMSQFFLLLSEWYRFLMDKQMERRNLISPLMFCTLERTQRQNTLRVDGQSEAHKIPSVRLSLFTERLKSVGFSVSG